MEPSSSSFTCQNVNRFLAALLLLSCSLLKCSGFVVRQNKNYVPQPSSPHRRLSNVKRKEKVSYYHSGIQYPKKLFRYDYQLATLPFSEQEEQQQDKEEEDITASSSSSKQQQQQQQPLPPPSQIEFQIHPSITSIPSESWNSCVQSNDSPFVEHSWLRCLEESGCVSSETGWIPQHLEMKLENNTVLGYIPMYLKTHSHGEFIFDTLWANAAYNVGITYYPKLVVAIPFTPASGTRILFHSSVYETYDSSEIRHLRTYVGTFLKQLAVCNKISSVHFNFVTDEEATDLSGGCTLPTINIQTDDDSSIHNTNNNQGSSSSSSSSDNDSSSLQNQVKSMLENFQTNGHHHHRSVGQSSSSYHDKDTYLRRASLQYQWTNQNTMNNNQPYRSFDDYLQCFKSKRRIKIKRERSKVLKDEHVRIDVVKGQDILKHDGLIERMFEIYRSTIDNHKMILESLGTTTTTGNSSSGSSNPKATTKTRKNQYLTLDFFQLLVQSDFSRHLCFMCARSKASGDEFQAEDVFAGTFNIVKAGVFYGRYWGCLPGREVKNLHFETCYWSAIEYCIRNGVKRMEPGAGGGDYKWARGFDAALIHSAHYIGNPGLRRAVSQFLEYEIENNVEVTEQLLTKSVVGGRRRRNNNSNNNNNKKS